MRRDEAERRLTGVVDQAREVNRDRNQLFCVESIELSEASPTRMLTTSATSTLVW